MQLQVALEPLIQNIYLVTGGGRGSVAWPPLLFLKYLKELVKLTKLLRFVLKMSFLILSPNGINCNIEIYVELIL